MCCMSFTDDFLPNGTSMPPPISLTYFDEQPTPLRPDYRRVTEHAGFKKLPPEMQALIEAEFLRYEEELAVVGELAQKIVRRTYS